jgi:hypothetical protein
MMCCKLPHIKELDKPFDVWCTHAVRGKGCGIYADRPAVCRAFYCGWMLDACFGPEWKPEKSKFIIWSPPGGGNLTIRVDPDFPTAWTKAPFYAQIKRWAVDAAGRNQFVLVRIGLRVIVVLPDRDADLGRVDPEADLIVSQRPGPDGPVYEFKIST